MGVQVVVDVVWLGESHGEVVLLGGKAGGMPVRELVGTYLVRPFQMPLDPICLLMTVYTSFVYGTSTTVR